MPFSKTISRVLRVRPTVITDCFSIMYESHAIQFSGMVFYFNQFIFVFLCKSPLHGKAQWLPSFCSSWLTSKFKESVLRDHIHIILEPAFLVQQRLMSNLLERWHFSKVVVSLSQDHMQIVDCDLIFCPQSPGSAAERVVYVTVSVIHLQEPHLGSLKHIPHEQTL